MNLREEANPLHAKSTNCLLILGFVANWFLTKCNSTLKISKNCLNIFFRGRILYCFGEKSSKKMPKFHHLAKIFIWIFELLTKTYEESAIMALLIKPLHSGNYWKSRMILMRYFVLHSTFIALFIKKIVLEQVHFWWLQKF